jgi:hypothetical protein
MQVDYIIFINNKRSGPEQPLAAEQCDKPGRHHPDNQPLKNKGGDVKQAGVQ